MFVKSVYLHNFRNYVDQNVVMNKSINIFSGDNAQGKTNALEAIYLCCTGFSKRAKNDKELIRFGENNAYIKLEVERIGGTSQIEIYFSRNEKKRIKINGMPLMRIGELMGTLVGIYFSPDELSLIKEAPEDRRRFMDIDLSQMSKAYFYSLSRYNKFLKNRNKLLKNFSAKERKELLPIWDAGLAKEGAKIVYQRLKFLERITALSKQAHFELSDGKEDLEVRYQTNIDLEAEDLEKEILKKLADNYSKDIELGYTTVGIHRDDIKITLNKIDVRSFGSQGQQRTAALSLKLAELHIFKEICGEYPILLLDDVLSELDLKRQKTLLKKIEEVQTVLTCTHIEECLKNEKNKEYRICGGEITELK